MLVRYGCGCVGLPPDGHEDGEFIVRACDSEFDNLPGNLSAIVAYRRCMRDPEKHEAVPVEQIQDMFEEVMELKKLAYLGQDFLSLTHAANRILEEKKCVKR